MSATLAPPVTPEDLITMPDSDHLELVDGELVEKPMSLESSAVCMELSMTLGRLIRSPAPGKFFDSTASYQCFPDDPEKVRRPDLSFMRSDRLPQAYFKKGHSKIAPDLAVEVISPSDSYSYSQTKVEEYIEAGVKLVWLIDPASRTISIHRHDGSYHRLKANDELSGEDIIPGFSCKVGNLFSDV